MHSDPAGRSRSIRLRWLVRIAAVAVAAYHGQLLRHDAADKALAAAIMLWWAGQNFIDVAPYIADAEYRSLPLILGMGEEAHDWGNLLTMLNRVESAQTYANISFTIGSLVMLLSFYWAGWILYLQKKVLDEYEDSPDQENR